MAQWVKLIFYIFVGVLIGHFVLWPIFSSDLMAGLNWALNEYIGGLFIFNFGLLFMNLILILGLYTRIKPDYNANDPEYWWASIKWIYELGKWVVFFITIFVITFVIGFVGTYVLESI